MLGVLIASSACGLMRWSTAKTTEVKWIRGGWWVAVNQFRQLDGALQEFALERKNPIPLTFTELQTSLTNYMRWGSPNCFTQTPLQNEATPGNLTLNQNSNGVDVLWYDINGGSHLMVTFQHSRPD